MSDTWDQLHRSSSLPFRNVPPLSSGRLTHPHSCHHHLYSQMSKSFQQPPRSLPRPPDQHDYPLDMAICSSSKPPDSTYANKPVPRSKPLALTCILGLTDCLSLVPLTLVHFSSSPLDSTSLLWHKLLSGLSNPLTTTYANGVLNSSWLKILEV